MIQRAASSDPVVRELLARHPRVESVEVGVHPGVDFQMGEWRRSVRAGDPTVEEHGLVELMDNNPLVCADDSSVPSPAATLALIGLGPLAWAGMLVEPPAFTCFGAAEEDLDPWLRTAGWNEGVTAFFDESDLGGIVSATAIAAIRTPADWSEIDDIFEERFGRSFFVRRDESSTWDLDLVRGKPFALYRMRYTPDEPHSLLTVSLIADGNGKCGAAQVLHCMNVMAGFEESLGAA